MKVLKSIGINCLIFCVAYLFLCAGINTIISPFFIAFAFACFYIEDNFMHYIFGLLFSRILYDFSLQSIIISVNFLAVIIILKLLQKRAKNNFKMWAIFLFMFLGSVTEILFALNRVDFFVLGVVNKLLEFAFLYAYMMLFRGIKQRGTNTRLALDELLGLALIIAPIAFAGTKIMIFNFSLSQVLIPLAILLISLFYGWMETLSFALIAGIGVSFKNLEFTMIAVWLFYGIVAVRAKNIGRIPMVLFICLVDLIVGFYFSVYDTYSLYNLIPIGVAGLIFVLIPRKIIRKIRLYIYDKYEELCLNEIIIQKERESKEKLKRVSGLFLQMHNIYKSMVIGALDNQQIRAILVSDITRNSCKNCSKYKLCYEGKGLNYRGIEELVKIGVSKNKVSLVDSPAVLASSCGRINQIIFQLNTRLNEYNQYKTSQEKEDEGKVLMSNQLLGVSEVLDEFSINFTFGTRASEKQERALIDSFLYNDIIVKECAIFFNETGFSRGILIVKNNKYKKHELLKVCDQFFKIKTKVLDVRYTKVSGWQIITIEPDYKFSYLSGVAKTSKHKKSGDTFSELFLENNKVVFAISDGKGCGEDAGKISEMTINLIENFYRAGFSSEHIMDNVNKVMSYKSNENFSAVDVATVDLNVGRVDFIKRGGTPSVIKKGTQSFAVEGADLPIGILENATSKTISFYLDAGDVVVLASDGIFDAFNNTENFVGFINNLQAINMQEFARNILNEAIRLNKSLVKDDMTVVAFKILLNR